MERLICLAIGYVCGLFQTSYIIGRLHKTDIQRTRKRKCRNHQCPAYLWEKGGDPDSSGGLPEMCGSDCSCASFPWKTYGDILPLRVFMRRRAVFWDIIFLFT